jgi:hypothetical protein
MNRLELLERAIAGIAKYDPSSPLEIEETLEIYEALVECPPQEAMKISREAYEARWTVALRGGLAVFADLLLQGIDAEATGDQETLAAISDLGRRLQASLQTLHAMKHRRSVRVEARV